MSLTFPPCWRMPKPMPHDAGAETIALCLPLINRAAMTYLLARGFRLDEGYQLFMSDEPFGVRELHHL